ncbi:MAG: hypothetical protein V4669_04850 [Pseudomonadota bacterium]
MQIILFSAFGAASAKRLAAAAVLSVSLTGCATFAPSVPEGYSGPVAIIKDSVKTLSQSKADFFYISEIDGKRMEDSRVRTLRMNQGRGFNMSPSAIERNVPAQKATFTLVGRTEYAAPILALTNTVYQVTGKITVSPETYRSYVVRGELGENYSAVWLEDETSGKVIGEKIEVNGPSKLGTFEK